MSEKKKYTEQTAEELLETMEGIIEMSRNGGDFEVDAAIVGALYTGRKMDELMKKLDGLMEGLAAAR